MAFQLFSQILRFTTFNKFFRCMAHLGVKFYLSFLQEKICELEKEKEEENKKFKGIINENKN